jgi:aryl-phospho-beta-D-glucosidase BglC (GH1 family)
MRLRHWGFNCLRFLTLWEAIEHPAPGEYDEAYLDYLYQVVKKAGEYGFAVFIDPHQDAWSRMSGGDGAQGWTLELAKHPTKQKTLALKPTP